MDMPRTPKQYSAAAEVGTDDRCQQLAGFIKRGGGNNIAPTSKQSQEREYLLLPPNKGNG